MRHYNTDNELLRFSTKNNAEVKDLFLSTLIGCGVATPRQFLFSPQKSDITMQTENQQTEVELWRPVLGYEGIFEVSSLGQVKRLPGQVKWNGSVFQKLPAKNCKIQVNVKGYCVISLMQKHQYLHRVVAMAFVEGRTELTTDVNHIDGNKMNNAASNLEWCNRKHNINHSFDHGLHKQGEDHKSAKLTKEIVIQILKTAKDTGLGKKNLHKLYFPNVSPSSIQQIIENRNWKSIDRNTI